MAALGPFSLPDLLGLLSEHGAGLLFLLAVLETSFVTGLVVPSGVATAAATVLALDGVLGLPQVAVAAAAGGFAGDTLGYWVGRVGRDRLASSPRRWVRWLRGTEGETSRFFGRHPAWSVTGARMVSFVRTLMPMAAGMSGMAYLPFLAYESVGLLAWLAVYMGVGALAQESWEAATRVVGVTWTLVFLGVGAVLWTGRRRRRRRARSGPASGRGGAHHD